MKLHLREIFTAKQKIMLIRFIAKNLFSFRDETEFNLLPNKTQRLPHHKVSMGEFEFLRFSAIYGANASGKSNLIKAISLLATMVRGGKLDSDIDNIKFKLNKENAKQPISLGIEFISGSQSFYYTITFERGKILYEYLAESSKEKDVLIFERSFENETQKIKLTGDYYEMEEGKMFVKILSEKLIQKDQLLITFLSRNYSEDFKSVQNAYKWFAETLVIIMPDTRLEGVAHILDKEIAIRNFANKFIPSLNTGISEIEIEKKGFEEFAIEDTKRAKEAIDELKKEPNGLLVLTHPETGEEVSLVHENDEIVTKILITLHQNYSGEKIEFHVGQESDGTKRLIDYVPALHGIITDHKVFLIDEIERSIHPITIKEILTKLALDETVKGQLIFTTHESNLLDQSILRPDEIWFAQKDLDGASKLYSLSDFKIHNTIDIENGYLKGRFGGIPFLGDLKELSW